MFLLRPTSRAVAPSGRELLPGRAAIIGTCVWLANRVPGPGLRQRDQATHSNLWLYVASLSGMLATMVIVSLSALPVLALAKVCDADVLPAFLDSCITTGHLIPAGPAVEIRRRQRIISFWILASPLMLWPRAMSGRLSLQC